MGTKLIIPEIALIEKIEELDTSLSPTLWEQMKTEASQEKDQDSLLPKNKRIKKRVLLSDFVNKAISFPLEITPEPSPLAQQQLTRLHLFCCQQSIHNPEVRHNPLILGFNALKEMKMALIGILTSYRLIHPECPYSWNETFFEDKIMLHKGPDGHTIVRFLSPLTADVVNNAVSEELVTDWLIYRAYDNNGIRTLMDIKNNLIDLPNYKRGGKPSAEFSRFERKMQEQRNKQKQTNDNVLELEFRKTLIQSVAGHAAQQLLASGVTVSELLNQAFNGDLTQITQNLIDTTPQKLTEKKETSDKNKLSSDQQQDTKEIENVIAGLLDEKA
ncbi:MAG: hypothetical protein J6W96_01780 [Alphaproteobacteria bacterium]|nr:hypothetical protein [Alphaproteobacteria bacterium]